MVPIMMGLNQLIIYVILLRVHPYKKKNKSAIKHINKALSVINCPYNNIDDIPYEGFTDQLAGQVGTYMATRATRFMADGGKKIALLTAMGYMSSFKSFCINKFR